MPMPTLITPLARAADLIETGHMVRKAVVSWGCSLEVAQSLDGVDTAIEDAEEAITTVKGPVALHT